MNISIVVVAVVKPSDPYTRLTCKLCDPKQAFCVLARYRINSSSGTITYRTTRPTPMTSALSPSLINLQGSFQGAGHLKASASKQHLRAKNINKMGGLSVSPSKSATAASSRSGFASTSTSAASSPSKKQRSSSPTKPHRSRSSRSLKRTTSTASIMDTIINSRAASDHDSHPGPLSQQQQPPQHQHQHLSHLSSLPASRSNIFEYSRGSTSKVTLADLGSENEENVLLTPRRGRRVGNVNMGWSSPLPSSSSASNLNVSSHVHHTLPRSRSTAAIFSSAAGSGSDSTTSSPSKRKASTAFTSELQQSQRSLVDTAGWASAAMISSVQLPQPDVSRSSPGFSPRIVASSPIVDAPLVTLGSGDVRDPMSAFIATLTPDLSQDPRLVPVEVEGLGRVAVHRDFVQQISDHGPVSGLGRQRRLSSCSDRGFGLLRGSDSEDSYAHSSTGSSTDPTSVGTPCPSGVSPSFSLSSQFPASEPASPIKKLDAAATTSQQQREQEQLAVATQEALAALMSSSSSSSGTPTAKNGSAVSQADLGNVWRPRLGGSQSTGCLVSAKLPTLDWPDSPAGPWSGAGKHVDELKQKRKENVQRWLESDSNDEAESSVAAMSSSTSAQYHHHPMVAKALLDRARRHQMMRAQAKALVAGSTAESSSAAGSPTKRRRKARLTPTAAAVAALQTPTKRRGRKSKAPDSVASSTARRSVATSASLARSDASAIFGCKCGIDDEAIVMVQCDSCRRWLHLPCVGINSVQELDDEWYCDDCCDAALTEHLSPASSLPTTIASYADLSTPEGIQALLSGQEPVFTLPSGTPIHRHGVAMSSSIALAPSPPMLSAGDRDRGTRSTVKRQGQGRSRAERVGWRMNEPGSPLARKSTTASSGVRPAVPETPSRMSEVTADFTDASSTPSLLAGFSRADWEPVRSGGHRNGAGGDRLTTPSPRLISMSTPSRHASGRKPSHSGPLMLGLGDDETTSVLHAHAGHADVFSTPSRLASGGSWATYTAGRSGAYAAPAGSQTPSRSGAGRHQRIDSFSGGLLTPSRDLLAGTFGGAEPSTSMPSLVYSSGYVDGLDEALSVDSQYSSNRAWQLQSPTSSTRAARARQPSGFGTPWSSSLLRTPELQPRQLSMSSMRGGKMDSSSDDMPPSSSPFPRTPTFDLGSPRFLSHSRQHSSSGGGGAHDRHASHLGLGLPSTSSSSARLHRAMGTDGGHLSKGSLHLADRSASNKHRQVSTDMPLGLGIGLDLDDVLDWH
ncbi:hypothetical protein BCV70DRAFT_230497 [Testicularia cyperi]|uniref:CW-type domain-containing protein n=1 Tax=Testicularia cyperi TaxID=1882483 RepID=A0A317XWW8_9BASI|nr:hypothetical protein BCV70DRAFT_230497 [Testicularia cyperi]